MKYKTIIFNALQTSLSGGIGRYSFELAKNLYLLHKDQIKLVIREEDKQLFDFADDKDLIIIKGINNSIKRNYFEQFKLPKMVKKNYPDAIIHYPDSMAPLFAKNKVVITIHDLAFLSLKKVFTWKTVLWKKVCTYFSVIKADKIIAITNFTKSEINKYYSDKVSKKTGVIYNGFNDFSAEEINQDNVRDDIKNLKSGYILSVSTISPRKNIDGLINAFNKIKNETNKKLVIAGNNGWLFDKIYDLVKTLKIEDRVFFTGKVNDDELKYLYKHCGLFTYLSVYEGFGLPPLEAMSYGKPCLVSNTTSIPEVVGDTVELVNPYDNKEISIKIKNIIENNKVDLEKYKEQLLKFSWEKCARDTFNCYLAIMRGEK